MDKSNKDKDFIDALAARCLSRRDFLRLTAVTGMGLVLSDLTNSVAWAQKLIEAKDNLHPALYYRKLADNLIQCELCPNRCTLKEDQFGICTVRVNKEGSLYTLVYGKPVALNIDPIEKKPFFHFLPGSQSFSIATAGCNLRCIFCQNWQISQARPEEAVYYKMAPKDTAQEVLNNNCQSIAYTYTEPIIFYEYMLDIAKLAKQRMIKNTMHSCGYVNPEPLKELCPFMDAVNIDLKGFTEDFYRKMGVGRLEPVLEAIKVIKEKGVWLEITNLIIPGANDNPDDIKRMCEWIRDNLGTEVPIHFSRFYPAFKLKNLPATPLETLYKARGIAESMGLKYAYIGNVPGSPAENTYCPRCKKLLVRRIGYTVSENNIVDNVCKFCKFPIAGVWV